MVLESGVTMGKIRRDNYTFKTWKGDHDPKHVHVYKDNKLIVKWDLENNQVMKGKITGRIRKLIEDLESENKL